MVQTPIGSAGYQKSSWSVGVAAICSAGWMADTGSYRSSIQAKILWLKLIRSEIIQ